jgi:protein dithiol oxidoreductase (disulfide-forming)
VDGTPSLIVNGKYRVVAPREGSFTKMLQITDWLVAKERAAKKAG